MTETATKIEEQPVLKLDLGCGKNKQAGFHGVDSLSFNGVDTVLNLVRRGGVDDAGANYQLTKDGYAFWPWKDDSVEEVFSSHFVEHLTGTERIHFFNELGRVMKKGGKASIITPDWSHACAYGDPTHQWPPMSSWYALYLNKEWRDINAPHVGYTCDFDWAHGASWDEWLNSRNSETKMFAMARYINSTRDLHISLIKR
jgi:SAM-dependent methyltransferase